MSGRDFTRKRVNPAASWYCVEFYRPRDPMPGPSLAPDGWISGNPRGMCYPTRAEAKDAAYDMAANEGVRTRVRRRTPFCRCYIDDVPVDQIRR